MGSKQCKSFIFGIRVFCFAGEKNGVKYLKIDKGDVLNIWNQVFNGIKYQKVIYDCDFDKIRFVTDDLLPLGKLIYFPTLTVVIRLVIKQRSIFYLQVYLGDVMYQL